MTTKVQPEMIESGSVTNSYRFLKRTIITATGDYTPDEDCVAFDVQCIGGGGGSGAAAATAAGQASAGSGGGAGGYTRKFYDQTAKEALVFPLAVTVGLAGSGGISGSTAPSAGGNTTFDVMTANGGAGGINAGAGAVNIFQNGGAGGSASGGNLNYRGSGGGASIQMGTLQLAGSGGDSVFGGGQRGSFTAGGFAGTSGVGFGSGASGATSGPSQAGFNGANGVAGAIIIDEYTAN